MIEWVKCFFIYMKMGGYSDPIIVIKNWLMLINSLFHLSQAHLAAYKHYKKVQCSNRRSPLLCIDNFISFAMSQSLVQTWIKKL